MKLKAVYCGSFDPITFGHEAIILAASKMYDLTVLVANNSSKKHLLTADDRFNLVKQSIPDNILVAYMPKGQLLASYCENHKIDVIVRGLRSLSDLDYELQIANTNADLCLAQTVFLPSRPELSYISSSMVKEVASMGGNVSKYVSSMVNSAMIKKFEVINDIYSNR